jgi:uncharacterized protein with FMN-binding domain
MNRHPRSHRPPGSDPLLVPPTPRGIDPSAPGAHTVPSEALTRRGSVRPPHRQHAARGARAVALAASVVATGAVTAALSYSEGAWSASSEVAADGSTDQLASSPATLDNTLASTAMVSADIATPTTLDTSAASTIAPDTTPETTQPAELVSASSGYANGVFLGTAEGTEWGDVQVQVTISSGGIVDVEAVQYPTGRKSSSINNQAIPMLEAEAVASQSADLDVVSGATYTSRTYADSLQAALDQAALAATQEVGSS